MLTPQRILLFAELSGNSRLGVLPERRQTIRQGGTGESSQLHPEKSVVLLFRISYPQIYVRIRKRNVIQSAKKTLSWSVSIFAFFRGFRHFL